MDTTRSIYDFPPQPRDVKHPLTTGAENIWKSQSIETLNSALINLVSSIADLKKEISNLNPVSTIQIMDLESTRFTLITPISVYLNKESDQFYAECVDFNIYGIGNDEKEAILHLKEAIINYFEELNSSKSKLSKKLISKLNLLKRIIKNEK